MSVSYQSETKFKRCIPCAGGDSDNDDDDSDGDDDDVLIKNGKEEEGGC